MSELLKPCPFCGSDDVHFASHPTTARWGVICDTCDVWRDDRCATKAEAATLWNARADLSDALLREAVEALGKLHHAVCGETGFAHCVRLDSGMAYPWPALDDADEIARATLAKLRAHLGETK